MRATLPILLVLPLVALVASPAALQASEERRPTHETEICTPACDPDHASAEGVGDPPGCETDEKLIIDLDPTQDQDGRPELTSPVEPGDPCDNDG